MSVIADNPVVFEVPVAPGECSGSYPGETKTFALNQDGTVNGCSNPAQPNSTVTIFVDGLGNLVPPGGTGGVTPIAAALTLPVSLYNATTPPSFVSGNSLAGSITGLYEIQIQIPPASGPAMLAIGPAYAQGIVAVAP